MKKKGLLPHILQAESSRLDGWPLMRAPWVHHNTEEKQKGKQLCAKEASAYNSFAVEHAALGRTFGVL
jgi:hypothetical protein